MYMMKHDLDSLAKKGENAYVIIVRRRKLPLPQNILKSNALAFVECHPDKFSHMLTWLNNKLLSYTTEHAQSIQNILADPNSHVHYPALLVYVDAAHELDLFYQTQSAYTRLLRFLHCYPGRRRLRTVVCDLDQSNKIKQELLESINTSRNRKSRIALYRASLSSSMGVGVLRDVRSLEHDRGDPYFEMTGRREDLIKD